MSKLQGKVVLIVGGSGGIGAASARMFAAEGARVAITHRAGKEASGQEVLATLPGEGHAAFPADVADTASLIALQKAVAERFGRLDVLVNSAGFTKPIPHGNLDAVEDAFIDQMFAVNWRGQFAAVRTFAAMLKASGEGLIVFISSICGAERQWARALRTAR